MLEIIDSVIFVLGLPCVVRFPEKIEEFIRIELHNKLFYFLKEDESKEVVSGTLEVIQDLIKDLGPAVIDQGLDALVELIILLLKNEGTCQGTNEDDVVSIYRKSQYGNAVVVFRPMMLTWMD